MLKKFTHPVTFFDTKGVSAPNVVQILCFKIELLFGRDMASFRVDCADLKEI